MLWGISECKNFPRQDLSGFRFCLNSVIFRHFSQYIIYLQTSQIFSLHTLFSKVIQWLAWQIEFWEGQWWGYILHVGDIIVYTLALSMPIFKKKSSRRVLGKSFNEKFGTFSQKSTRKFFLAKVYTKKRSQIEI